MSNYKFQKIIVAIGILLFIVKITAWYFTHSVAILTDALESIVNIISSFIGLYSIYLSARPRDENHPYGHGKIEFVSAAVEGSLIGIAGFIIIYESIINLNHPRELSRLDFGIYLISFTAVVNYLLGMTAVKMGKKTGSLALEASGKHLKSDTYSTLGLIIGLFIIYITGIRWLDSVVALVFAGIIIYTGYKILRESLRGIMDETDGELLQELVELLEKERKEDWIDLHNLRVIKYGNNYHIDCHVTLPYYYSVREAHECIEAIDYTVSSHFGKQVEFFIHIDPCETYSCKICSKSDCPVRSAPFTHKIGWNIKNISTNQKHRS